MHELKIKNINGLQVSYREAGSGELLLCLHAIGHDSADYLSVLEFFKDTHKVVALDWPGHGKSDRLADQPILRSSYEAWLTMVCSHFGWERFSIIGNSIGGDVAIRFAHAYPQQVQGLVLANPGGLLPMNFLSKSAIGFMVWFCLFIVW